MAVSAGNIVFIEHKQSIIVRGLKKRMEDYGYDVKTLSDNFSRIEMMQSDTDVFVVYFSENVMKDSNELRSLNEIHSYLNEFKCKIVTIGEPKDQDDITRKYPLFGQQWESRPIDAGRFCGLLEGVVKSANIPESEAAPTEAKEDEEEKSSLSRIVQTKRNGFLLWMTILLLPGW